MPIPFKAAIDLEKNELQNARVQNLASDPGTPVAGQVYYNTTSNVLKYYTGSTWVTLGRLDQISAPTGDVNLNSQRVTNLATPTATTDAATKGYVDAVAQGIDAKASVKAATTANITLSGAQTIDGVSCVAGDRVLVKNQTTGSQNGIYVVAAGSWTRAGDMDAWTEVPGAFTFVESGSTLADTAWVCSSDPGGTLGSTAITWVQFGSAASYTASGGVSLVGNDFRLADMAATSVKGRSAGSTGAPADITASADNQVLRRASGTLAFGTIDTAAIGSGTLAAARMPALTGDVTTSAGTVATTIANNAVSNVKLADMATQTIKGRTTTGTGDPEDLTAAQVRAIIGAPRSYVANVGATSSGAVTVTHSLGTRDVQVQVYRIASPYETIYCDCERTDTNTVTLRFGADYAVDTFRIVVQASGV